MAGRNSLFVVFSGCLYNSAEIIRTLAAEPLTELPAEPDTFASLALSAYTTWGPTFPDHFDGEFAFALWDSLRQTVVLGRDAMGQEPLHYGVHGTSLVFASEPRGLMGWHGLGCRVDDETLVRNLVLQPDRTRTLFRDIRSVPTGHVMIAESSDCLRLIQYWNPLAKQRVNGKDCREYAEGLRAAMERAVAIRCPRSGIAASMLSSGFDSASVTVLAARQLAAENRPLIAFTSAPTHSTSAGLQPGRFADEWPLAAAVAKSYPNVEHIRVGSADADWWKAMDALTDALGGPPAFLRNFRWFYAILTKAKQRGVSTIFEGSAGNLTGSYDGSLGLFDLRRRGDLTGLMRAISSRRKQAARWKQIVYNTWLPKPRVLDPICRMLGTWRPNRLRDISMLRPQLFDAAGLSPSQISIMGATAEGNRTSGAHWRFHLLQRMDMGMTNAAYARLFGIRRVDPTADRQVIEFCLSIPDEAFAQGGIPRQLYRDAMQGLLPSELLNQTLRGQQSSDFVEMFNEELPRFQEEVERIARSPEASRVLDVERMRAALECWPQDSEANPVRADQFYNFTFGGALTMGRFLRRFEEAQQG